MNSNHRIFITRFAGVLAGAVLIAASLWAIPSAEAQVPPEACEALEQGADTLDPDGENDGDPAADRRTGELLRTLHQQQCQEGGGSTIPEPACEALEQGADTLDPDGENDGDPAADRRTGELLRTLHQQQCQEDGETTTTTTTTTTTVPQEEEDAEPLVTSDDGALREVKRLPFERVGNQAAHLELDLEKRRGYRIYGGATTRIATINLDRLTEGAARTYPEIDLGISADSPGHPYEVVATTGGNRLYFVDFHERVQVIDGRTLRRLDSFAPPLLRDTGAPVRALGTTPGDTLDSATSERGFSGAQVQLNGLAYLAPYGAVNDPKLLAVTENAIPTAGVGNKPNAVTLEQWDAATGRTEWSVRLDACRSTAAAVQRKYGLGLAVAPVPGAPNEREVHLGCIGSSGAGEVWRVRLAPDGSGVQSQELVTRASRAIGFLPDPSGRRMIVMSSVQKQFYVGVDLTRGGVYGAVVAGLEPHTIANVSVGSGLDPATGRVYSYTRSSSAEGVDDQGGLLVVDARRRPMVQGLQYPELNPNDLPGNFRITVDPATGTKPRRVFVPEVPGDGPGEIRVFEDTLPVLSEAQVAEVDRFTVDVKEEEGKTRAAFNGSTSAYGARVLHTGGLYGVTDQDGIRNSTENASAGVLFGCEPPDRQLVLAQVMPRGTNLANTGVNASALAADVDERTRQDLDRPVAACWPTQGIFSNLNGNLQTLWNIVTDSDAFNDTVDPLQETILNTVVEIPSSDPDDGGVTVGELLGDDDLFDDEDDDSSDGGPPQWPNTPPSSAPDDLVNNTVEDPWPFRPAQCSVPGRSDTRPHEGEDDLVIRASSLERSLGPVPGYTAHVACGDDGRSLVARSTAAADLGVDSLVTFDGAEATAIVRHQDDGGVVAVTEAKTRGVSVAGALRIGEIRTRAVSIAEGRPGTARTTVERVWCEIVGLGESDTQACQDVEDPAFQENVRSFSDNVLGNFGLTLRIPPADPELRQGTPGGALAAVQKDRFLVVGERLLNNDPRTELAAMEIIEVRDSSQGRARHLYQFAGVEASTAYNISRVLSFDFNVSVPRFDGPPTFAPPAASALAQGATSGTAPTVTATPASSGNPASIGPDPGGILQAVGQGLRWLLRHPWEVLKFMMILFTAWALPLHLHEKRRVLAATTLRGD